MGIDPKRACELIRKLDGVTEKDHFGGDAFSANKRMFATLWHDKKKTNLRFTPEQQRRFLESDEEVFTEIDNAWGRQGWASVNLEFVDLSSFRDAIEAAHVTSKVKTTTGSGGSSAKARPVKNTSPSRKKKAQKK